MILVFTSANESALNTLQNQISLNCGFPDNLGTEKWSDILKADNEDLYYFPCPKESGFYNQNVSLSYEQMMSGTNLNNISIEEYQDAWSIQDGDN